MGMGSMMEHSDNIPSDPIVPKPESIPDGYTSSSASTPEPDIGPPTQDVVLVQKRKGGRKPIYATSEERKQRNRQAQAAFRERRTEYIKQLENTIKHHEDSLQSLQQSHRSAADECLMLRYKNSLLERILLEKGIDVQAELRMKGSPHLGPTKTQQPVAHQASPIQRAMMNRQQAARSNSTSAMPPLQPINNMMQGGHENNFSHAAPYPRNPSKNTSPSCSRPPGFTMQAEISSPNSNFPAQRLNQQQRPQVRPHRNSFNQQPTIHRHGSGPLTTPPRPTPDQEFDPQAEMLDDAPGDDAGPDQFIPNFRLPAVSMSMQSQAASSGVNLTDAGGGSYGGSGNPPFDSYDPMLDADPFGLSASMHFPTPYTYDSHQNRR